jgi:hypothetical protein
VSLHRKKKAREFPVLPSRDVTTKLSLGGNNDVITELFLPRGSFVSDIPAGDGKLVNLFLRCCLHLLKYLATYTNEPAESRLHISERIEYQEAYDRLFLGPTKPLSSYD